MGWQTKRLSDVCAISSALIDPRDTCHRKLLHVGGANIESYTGRLSDLKTAEDEKLISGKFLFDDSTVLYSKIRPYLVKVARPDFKGLCSADIYPLVPRPHLLDRDFLYYLLLTQDFTDYAIKGSARAGMPKVNREHLFAYTLALPPLPEQQRIVGILDEAFAGIATAKATAEKNRRNARELFDGAVDVIFVGLKSETPGKPLSKVVEDISTGPFGSLLHKSDYQEGGIPLINPINIEGDDIVPDPRKAVSKETAKRLSRYILREGDVVTARRGEIGRCSAVTPEQSGWICGTGSFFIRPGPDVDPRFLTHLIRSQMYRSQLERLSARATMPSIGNDNLAQLMVHVPDFKRQQQIEIRLCRLSDETERVRRIYERKLAALDALKKSLLHQAFSGRLTAGQTSDAESRNAVTPFPITIPDISTTDLHAGILAIACKRHEAAGKLNEFTHVKAEKFAHMIEAHLGFELGRKPVKDAAGPNDFKHLKGVEHRARMARFFDFKKVSGGAYRVEKLGGFDRLIEKTRKALGGRVSDVEKLLEWMLPMNVRQAEIVATVYGAWNNLLLDGKHPTDEEIVYESRENWHPDKLKIERERFFIAVQWLREQDVVPDGKGKRVVAKGK